MSEIAEKAAALRAAFDAFTACDIGLLTKNDLLPLLDEIEVLGRQLPGEFTRLLARLQTEVPQPRTLGAKTWNEVLRTRWRLSSGEASRRLGEVRDLHPQPSITGPPLPPRLPAVAAARTAGAIPTETVTLLRDTMRKIPAHVDAVTRSQVEVELVRDAVGGTYDQLRTSAALRLFLLDQDGPEPDPTERDRRRGATVGRQATDLLTELTVTMTPELAAAWEVLFAKFAAPGMCNPGDADMCTTGTPSQAQIDRDDRTPAQRRHDAMVAVARIALQSDLGKLNGLPVSIIIRTTLTDLESRGIAVTGGGTLVTMGDLDRLGGHAAYHLCVFDGATGSALNHFRSKRVATAAQRIMLIAKYGGCTRPGCPVGPYGCQIHHAVADWADGGLTNVDDMVPACGADNRLVEPGGYATAIDAHGECEWIPPPDLDTGQTRINVLHRPDLLLTPADPDTTDTVQPEVEPEVEVEPWDGESPPFDPPTTPPRWRAWTDEEHAAFDARYPNGPFAPEDDETPTPPSGFTRFHISAAALTSRRSTDRTRRELRRLLTHSPPGGPAPPG